ncbi:hypothetical protein [Veillonella caviae]|uniref:hypothetical protein n=1 Tax=Veillonella caviae TaxID=248316 RepID=UPI000F8E049A|nr:hypothetical protein [Veillonella caviae]
MSKFVSGLGRALSLLSNVLGNTREHPTIIISQGDERIVLPVTPSQYNVGIEQGNTSVTITQIGEALLFGNPQLTTLSFDGLLPAKDYSFIVGDKRKPIELISIIQKWMQSKQPVRVIISDGPINLMMAIMSFPYKKHDNTGDIYYSLFFKEYKDLNTSSVIDYTKSIDAATGLKDRPNINTKPTTATLFNRGSDILDAAKKAYGNYRHYERIIQSNDLKNLAINNLSELRRLKV